MTKTHHLAGFCHFNDTSVRGREEEIRTLDTVARIHTFQACSFNHSDTSLFVGCKYSRFPAGLALWLSFLYSVFIFLKHFAQVEEYAPRAICPDRIIDSQVSA